MKRRLFNLLTLVSLLLGVAVVAPALWGHFVSGGATFGPQGDRLSWRFTWRDGRLYTYFCPGYVTRFSLEGPSATFAGVHYARGQSPEGIPIVSATMTQGHVWAAGLLLAVAPALWVGRRLRDTRHRPPGTCPGCGYDLRATPDQCPECGDTPAPVNRHLSA